LNVSTTSSRRPWTGPEPWKHGAVAHEGRKTLLSKAALDEMRNLSGEAPRLVLGEVHCCNRAILLNKSDTGGARMGCEGKTDSSSGGILCGMQCLHHASTLKTMMR